MRELDAYRGPVFESIAEQACTRLRGTARLPTIREWGRWEGLDRNRQQIEIDVVARLHRWKDVDGRRQVESQARRSFARKSAELAVLYSGVHERATDSVTPAQSRHTRAGFIDQRNCEVLVVLRVQVTEDGPVGAADVIRTSNSAAADAPAVDADWEWRHLWMPEGDRAQLFAPAVIM